MRSIFNKNIIEKISL